MHKKNADEHIITIRKKVNDATIDLKRRRKISQDDMTIIKGLTDKNKLKQALEYRTESPCTYQLFRINKTTEGKISTGEITTSEIDTCVQI